MCAVKDGQSVVIDREPDQDKSLPPPALASAAPLCGWTPRKEDHWSCSRGHLEHVRLGRDLPRLPSPMDFNPVLQVWRVVAAFGSVCEVKNSNSRG